MSATPSPTSRYFLDRKLSGALTLGSDHDDASELKGMEAINAAFATATGLKPTLNTIDHNTDARSVIT
jgi:hypothetical protein